MGSVLVGERVSTPKVHPPALEVSDPLDQSALVLEKEESGRPGSSSLPDSHVPAESR